MNNAVIRLSEVFLRTLRDDPADAEVNSHKLLVRAGYIRQVAPGIFTWLPLGLRVLAKVEQIIREEMQAIGGNELHFPALLPREPYEMTNRWDEYGNNIFRLQDRRNNDYLLAPTHEEMFALIVKDICNSYKDLPVQLFQIQTKYRDEVRPRAGLLRGREFIMKDAYSFDVTDDGLAKSYQLYKQAYQRIFERLGLPYVIVEATSGAMGGSASEEFLTPTEIGEDTFVVAPSGYAANVEAAQIQVPDDLATSQITELPTAKELLTPGLKTIDELSQSMNRPADQFLKAVYLMRTGSATSGNKDSQTSHATGSSSATSGNKDSQTAFSSQSNGQAQQNEQLVIVFIPGHRELDLKRVEAHFAPSEVRIATDDDLKQYPQVVAGFVGPTLANELANELAGEAVEFYYDTLIYAGSSWVAGGNQVDTHIDNLVAGRDFALEASHRISVVEVVDGDLAQDGSGKLEIHRGIEIGHIFALGRKYTSAFDLTVLDSNGKAVTPTMGSYGIGVTRVIALLAELYSDDKGLAWPEQVAPADVHIVVASKDETAYEQAEQVGHQLAIGGVEVLLDDRRGTSPGVKFKDAELLGVPKIVVFGRGLQEDVPVVEVKNRDGSNSRNVQIPQIIDNL
jgi:prolyl-tRNA synthetase